jgi:hypothetical protein
VRVVEYDLYLQRLIEVEARLRVVGAAYAENPTRALAGDAIFLTNERASLMRKLQMGDGNGPTS